MTLPTPVSDQIVTPTRHTHILKDNIPSTHRMSRYKNINRNGKAEDRSPTNQQTVTPLIAQPNFSGQATVAKPATDADVTDNDSKATNPDARSKILKWHKRITRLGPNINDSVLIPCKSQAPSSGAIGKTIRFTEKPRRGYKTLLVDHRSKSRDHMILRSESQRPAFLRNSLRRAEIKRLCGKVWPEDDTCRFGVRLDLSIEGMQEFGQLALAKKLITKKYGREYWALFALSLNPLRDIMYPFTRIRWIKDVFELKGVVRFVAYADIRFEDLRWSRHKSRAKYLIIEKLPRSALHTLL
ncbi:hypothetical protein PT974_09990 [Cladobotryum mycophilum]|uniref:Uncharacterized protein n=1 Tax=Cladobotryum mycophilum TaxID=491253 RepID=A0ABR0S8L6_9HYPO